MLAQLLRLRHRVSCCTRSCVCFTLMRCDLTACKVELLAGRVDRYAQRNGIRLGRIALVSRHGHCVFRLVQLVLLRIELLRKPLHLARERIFLFDRGVELLGHRCELPSGGGRTLGMLAQLLELRGSISRLARCCIGLQSHLRRRGGIRIVRRIVRRAQRCFRVLRGRALALRSDRCRLRLGKLALALLEERRRLLQLRRESRFAFSRCLQLLHRSSELGTR